MKPASEGKAAHLALKPAETHQLFWFSLLCVLYARADVSPARQVLFFSNCRSLREKWQKRGCMKAQLEGSLGAPHQVAAEPFCLHHPLLVLLAPGQPEVLCNPAPNAAVRSHGRIWFKQESIGLSRKESKGWKRIKELAGSKHRGSPEDLQPPPLSSSALTFASH